MSELSDLHTPNEVREAFRAFLVGRGIRCTPARSRILDAVIELDDHFEADQLLRALTDKGLRVGKATVYRTLPLLVECGILKQVRFDDKQAHYEHAFGAGPHDHMVCRRCGRIVEFAADEVLHLRSQIAERHHFHPISHRFQISGLCWQCSIVCPVATTPRVPAASE